MTRTDLLAAVAQAVTADRQATHGRTEDSFQNIAAMWTVYLRQRFGCGSLEPHDVAAMMVLLKVARVSANPGHDDNWVDVAGYAACGCELVEPKVRARQKKRHRQEEQGDVMDDIR